MTEVATLGTVRSPASPNFNHLQAPHSGMTRAVTVIRRSGFRPKPSAICTQPLAGTPPYFYAGRCSYCQMTEWQQLFDEYTAKN